MRHPAGRGGGGLAGGTRTVVDVLATPRNLHRAKLDFAQTRYDYINNGLTHRS
ncbi:hypothetical protein [Methylococcus sp. EFPC2]|uniref:hypothetical protein n=1 Tax=Methylococcus sp. EFPC2 TaxID=2812648 RepID=UPI0019683328|nr:hypothetical protein [Methylococcus sp. EFPC2]QSA98185.1 hypothetical protein JWZ97_05040 [Methylococcus sp. EFPC2]